MKIKTDIFGKAISVGDYVIRNGGGNEFVPCKVDTIAKNKNGDILRIRLIHPWWNRYGFWDWKRKLIFPSTELIKVSKAELTAYCGYREGWKAGFVRELIS